MEQRKCWIDKVETVVDGEARVNYVAYEKEEGEEVKIGNERRKAALMKFLTAIGYTIVKKHEA